MDATPGLVGIPVSAAESPRTPAPPPTGERLFMGKPLRWTRGWTVVVAIWVLVAVALLLVRTQMTYLIDYSIEEQAAVDAVPFALMPDGETTYHEALAAATVRLTLAGDLESSAQWYVWSRPWEGRIYVWLEYREDDRGLLVLGWWVEDGRVNADPATDRFLESALDDNALLELPGKLPDFLR